MAQPNKLKPPTTPRVRTLHDVASTLEVVPYFLAGDHEKIARASEIGALNTLFTDDEYFAVAVGHLKLRHYLDYERTYGEPVDTTVNRMLWLFWAFNKVVNPDMDKSEVPNLEVVDGKIETPFGPLVGSMALNLAEFFGWALSRFGRIIGINDDGTYAYEAVSPAEIVDMLDPNALLKVDEQDKTPLFFEILSLTGLYNPSDVRPKEDAEDQDDDLGNSASPNSERGSTRKPKKPAKPSDA